MEPKICFMYGKPTHLVSDVVWVAEHSEGKQRAVIFLTLGNSKASGTNAMIHLIVQEMKLKPRNLHVKDSNHNHHIIMIANTYIALTMCQALKDTLVLYLISML